ncbi:MAG: hypothetical protein ACK5Q5_00680 [Planctomycetaceae bacterium]
MNFQEMFEQTWAGLTTAGLSHAAAGMLSDLFELCERFDKYDPAIQQTDAIVETRSALEAIVGGVSQLAIMQTLFTTDRRQFDEVARGVAIVACEVHGQPQWP